MGVSCLEPQPGIREPARGACPPYFLDRRSKSSSWSGVRRPEGPLIRAGLSLSLGLPSWAMAVCGGGFQGAGGEPGPFSASLETPERPTWMKQALGLHTHVCLARAYTWPGCGLPLPGLWNLSHEGWEPEAAKALSGRAPKGLDGAGEMERGTVRPRVADPSLQAHTPPPPVSRSPGWTPARPQGSGAAVGSAPLPWGCWSNRAGCRGLDPGSKQTCLSRCHS